jgi:hypothetical protein
MLHCAIRIHEATSQKTAIFILKCVPFHHFLTWLPLISLPLPDFSELFLPLFHFLTAVHFPMSTWQKLRPYTSFFITATYSLLNVSMNCNIW